MSGRTAGGIEEHGGPSAGRSAGIVLLVVGASAVVAFGVSDAGLLAPPIEPGPAWTRGMRMAGAAAAALGLVALLVQGRRLGARGRRGSPAGAGLIAAATVMGVLTLIALLAPGLDPTGLAPTGESAGGPVRIDPDAPATSRPPSPPETAPVTEGFDPEGALPELDPEAPTPEEPGPGGAGEDGSGWRVPEALADLLLLVLLLALGAVGMLAFWRRRERGRPDPPTSTLSPGDGETAPEAWLARWTPSTADPRGQVTAAYHRLLAALAAAGAPRRPEEAPHEHLRRAEGPLGLQPGPMHRLAELYVAAQFGARPVTEAHRAAADDALRAGLDALGATAHRGSSGSRTPPPRDGGAR